MAPRGSYSKGIAKRTEILDAALELVARVGFRRTTVRELADAVGLSQSGLLHHFGTKEQLFTEILRYRDEVDRRTFAGPAGGTGSGELPAAIVNLVRHNAEVPGLVQLYSRYSSEAADPGHPAHDFFRQRYEQARGDLTETITRLRTAGRLPADLDGDRLAVLVFAMIDGLQMQWMYDSSIDMADHIAFFWEMILGAGPEPHSRS
ncbi:TetR/AcrR family transcriptional regulator [Nocardia sp. NPDC024068]|uniref:TetR/AcrR family transcriptional regulator n=1 Tax=Nocardia sp. NPDC024068 TaxID=3157197 RepID=UPI0033ED9E6D